MDEPIEKGFMAFIAEGKEGIGAVREVWRDHIMIYAVSYTHLTLPTKRIV